MFSAAGDEQAGTGCWVYVRCKRCGEVIKTRIDLQSDLSQQEQGGYLTRKTLVGNQHCFERIEVELTFDKQRRLVGRQISGGDFITVEGIISIFRGRSDSNKNLMLI